MSDRPTRGGRGGSRGGSGGRGGFRGGRGGRGGSSDRGGRSLSRDREGDSGSSRGGRFSGGSRGGGSFRGESRGRSRGDSRGGRGGTSERGGRAVSRERDGGSNSEGGSRFSGGSRGGSTFRRESTDKPREEARGSSERGTRSASRGRAPEREGRVASASRDEAAAREDPPLKPREEARKIAAEAFVKSGRAARDAERLAKHREEREAAKVKARTTRIDPRVESITVGTKQVWKDSQEEANWCKLSTKFFTFEKIKKIKVTIDCRFKIKSIKYRTDIHFDDITHILVRISLNAYSPNSLISNLDPTLLTPITMFRL